MAGVSLRLSSTLGTSPFLSTGFCKMAGFAGCSLLRNGYDEKFLTAECVQLWIDSEVFRCCNRRSPRFLACYLCSVVIYEGQFKICSCDQFKDPYDARSKPDKPVGPTFDLTAEQVTHVQLSALQDNDKPYTDHGIEVMYRFAGFDPFKRSEYFGPLFDLGQFERFRRILHHTSFRVLLSHTDRRILSSLFVNEHCFKQRVRIVGARPGEEEIYEFTLVQRVGGNWDGYWLTESLRHDGEGASGGIAY